MCMRPSTPSTRRHYGLKQGYIAYPFFKFAILKVLGNFLSDLSADEVTFLQANTEFDLDFDNDIVLLSSSAYAVLYVLHWLVVDVPRYDVGFAPSKCKVLRQNYKGPVSIFTFL